MSSWGMMRQAKGSVALLLQNQSESNIFLVLDLTIISASITVGIASAKKAKLGISPATGILKGFVPAATTSHLARSESASAGVGLTAASSHGDIIDSDINFKMGGLENLDEGGNEVADQKYPKYAEIRAEARGRNGYQVHVSEYSCMLTVDSISYRL